MDENELSNRIIGAAIEVHRELGPGLLESVYEEALCCELGLRSMAFQRQLSVEIGYKAQSLATGLRLDLVVENLVIVEVKAKERLSAMDRPQLLTYLRLTGMKLGLLLNFHEPLLKDGVHRVVNGL